ncbi:MAG: DNA polymerase III subunit epsilon [Holosporaceae bacterium]|jgi:DNA polymerase-3 subunit epsilon|nr:DNA polymerase III subunit epsilon [Holosporaceae bacterium]
MSAFNNFREIVFDTETTGLSHENGDRIVDIGCVELINRVPTGNVYQAYVNPEREMSPGAVAISGITTDFLADKPLFHEIVDDFLNFLGDAKLVIHNAKFDMGFLNSELKRAGRSPLNPENVVDTLEIARKKFPGSPASLDALCKRFGIDASARLSHGALVDSRLLTEVYINLLGGRQSDFSFSVEESPTVVASCPGKQQREERFFKPSSEELAAHRNFLKNLKSPLWDNMNA